MQGDELEAGTEERPGRFADLAQESGEAEDLTAALTWTYPHEAAVSMPSKLTATQLKGRVWIRRLPRRERSWGAEGKSGSRRAFPGRTSWCRSGG